MVGGMSNVFYLFHIHGIGGACHIVLSSCFNLHKHESGAITLTGICKVYEMQLKSASQQIGTIDQINDQSRHMAQQIEQLNSIYARMIEAMTVNMKGVSNA